MRSRLFALALLFVIGCDDGRVPVDAGLGADAGAALDASPPLDAGGADAGEADAGAPFDAGLGVDAGEPDAGPSDAGPSDAGPPDAGPPDAGPPDAGPPDAGPTASAAECFEGWRTLPSGACPAPVITASYVGTGCVGSDGWFIEGANFQFREDRVGVADLGPQSIGVNGNQSHWNVITTELLCVTIARAGAGTWAGHDVHVVNPDGQRSNTVTIGNRF